MSRPRATRTVDTNLVLRLQKAVSGSTEAPADAPNGIEPGSAENAARDIAGVEPMPDYGSVKNLVTRTRPRAFSARAQRTTLSVPISVGQKARQLTMAITVAEQQDASLGQTLSWALKLLEAELRKKDIQVADRPVRLRSGPRDRL